MISSMDAGWLNLQEIPRLVHVVHNESSVDTLWKKHVTCIFAA
jgi:hypothetical protein